MRRFMLIAGAVCCAAVAHAAGMLKPGDTFPAWSLPDQSGTQVSSKQMTGKMYLLWFYPKAMTPGCTAEGDGLRDNFTALQQAGVSVLGVSFDTPTDNVTFVRQQHFPFSLLSDTDRTLAVAVGAATSSQDPVARRVSYLVGADGKVLRAYGTVNPSTHAQEVLADIAVLSKPTP